MTLSNKNHVSLLGLVGLFMLTSVFVLSTFTLSSVRAETNPTSTGSGSWYGDWGGSSSSGSGTTFTDITGHWSQSYIGWLSAQCGVDGYKDVHGSLLGLYKPDNNVTRAEFVKMFMGCKYGNLSTSATGSSSTGNPSTSSGSTTDSTGSPQAGSGSTGSGWTASGSVFPDVSTMHWAYPYIMKARETGLVTGYADGQFYPNKNISRAEIIAIVLRSEFADANMDNAPALFTDVPARAWYAKYVNFGASKAIVTGYKDAGGNMTNMFGPDNPATRGEAAKIISNGVNAG